MIKSTRNQKTPIETGIFLSFLKKNQVNVILILIFSIIIGLNHIRHYLFNPG